MDNINFENLIEKALYKITLKDDTIFEGIFRNYLGNYIVFLNIILYIDYSIPIENRNLYAGTQIINKNNISNIELLNDGPIIQKEVII
jgi:hypothetical protein